MPGERLGASGGPVPAADPAREIEELRLRAEAALAAERRIADRFARLHASTAALSAAVTAGDVAAVIAARGVSLTGAAACGVGVLTEDGGAFEVVAVRAPHEQAGARSGVAPIHDIPLAVALRERRGLFLPDRSTPERDDSALAVAAACGLPDRTAESVAALPLAAGPHLLGVVGIAYAAPRPFDEEERAFLEAFTHQCAQALDRARLYEAERAARLEAQRAEEAARRAVELQERLVGVVGHDLRTPLAAIRMATGLLFRRGGLNEEQARTLARLGASAARMTSIIRDLLDFTRVRKEGAIPVQLRAIDLAELARRAVVELSSVHPEREILLELPDLAPGEGDPERLTQVVSNLVGNALQHSPPRAGVHVLVEAKRDALVVEVHNDGPPIRPELLPEIFEPFRRGARGADPSDSIGLGLFIVRELVRAHGGTVEVRSSQREGTTFTVRLPAPQVAGPADETAVPTGRPATDH
jgi:signal transduction histidine kinase